MNAMKTALLLAMLASPLTAAEWFGGPQKFTLSGEVLAASDIKSQSYLAAYEATEGPWTLDAEVGMNRYSLDYLPTIFGVPADLDESTWSGNVALGREWNRGFSTDISARIYDGFSEYRSIWISEFYRQLFGEVPQYEAPDPHGFGFSLTNTWHYQPNAGLAEIRLDYGSDTIAPGWAFDPERGAPAPDRDDLETIGASLRIEQAINPWLETELVLSARGTTDREPRYAIRNSWAAAAGPVGFRLTAGYAEEAPSFDSYYGELLVDWNFARHWSVFASGRIYHDSGEIESAGFDALAPELDSSEIFAGVRFDDGSLAVSLGVGFLDTDYAPINPEEAFFGNLYRDREWWTTRIAVSYRF